MKPDTEYTESFATPQLFNRSMKAQGLRHPKSATVRRTAPVPAQLQGLRPKENTIVPYRKSKLYAESANVS